MKEEKKKIDYSAAWKEARRIVWERRRRMLLGLLLLLVNRLAGFVLPSSSKYLIDDVLGKGNAELLGWLAIAVIVATLVQGATTFGLAQILSVAAQYTIAQFRKVVERHVVRLPVSYFDSTKSGVLISRVMSDAEGIRNLVGTGIVQLIGGIFTAILALGVLFWLNWAMTVVLMVVLAGFGAGVGVVLKRVRPIFRERARIQADVTGRLGETLGAIRTVKAFRSEKHEDRVFAQGVHRLFRNIASTITALSGTLAISNVILGAAGVTIMWWGGRAVLAGQMSLGDLVMYIFFTAMVAGPVVQIASIGTQISEALAGLDRIHEVRSMTTEVERDRERRPLRRIRGDVEFEDVWFEYDEGVPVLRGVSLQASAGTTTALVGSSGSGKSTLISLILAFNRPLKGRVLVDGVDLKTVRLRDYRSFLGVVLQDNVLFDGTIAENIGYANPRARRQEIIEAARIAHVDEFAESFEKGYDTIVGERGVKLSGGQRQRVAIARAIIADPVILVLDEATSNLDSESEARIQEGLRRLRRGRTTFVIAHRLSTIRSADQILVIEEGQVVERGNHAQLMAQQGRYKELHDKQYRLESDLFINPGEDFSPQDERPAVERAPRGGHGH
ncbi:MAG TPA: ABC transporter ATP-binding protein [Acidobacteriota bacterium]|nr:ABC transporter ATP-binding protein [Acidobacteriota bacterium]